MTEWASTTVASVATLIKRGKAPLYAEHGMPVLNQKCIRANKIDLVPMRYTDPVSRPVPDYAIVRSGDVLITSTGRGTAGRSALAPELGQPFTVDSHVSIVRPSERVLPRYLVCAFSWRQADLEDLQSGSTNQTELSPSAIGSLTIPLPPLIEQHRIVDVMAAVDAQVESLREEAAALRSLLDKRTEAIFVGFAESGERAQLGDVLQAFKRPVSVDPVDSYLQIGVRSHGRGVFTKEAVTGAELGSKKVYWVEPGDLVINIVFAWEGAVAVIPSGLEGYCGSHRFPTYRRTDGADVDYFRFYFSTTSGRRLLGDCSPGGAGRNRTLNRKRLMAAMVPFPGIGEQEKATSELKSLEQGLTSIDTELTQLCAFRAALLSALLNREIEIPEAYDVLLEAVS